jgi:hypothetical protein
MGQLVDRDEEHLRLLRWGFYILAGISGFFSLFSLIYIALGGIFASGTIPPEQGSEADPRTVGVIFLVLGVSLLLLGLTGTLLTYLAGKSLGQRRRRVFCMVIGGLWCLSIPFGTAIGVATILVLNRPSVRELFEGAAAPPSLPPAVPA